MNPIAPPPPIAPPAATPPAAAVPASAPLTNLPPGLANLTAGAILNGSVISRDAQGHFLVQTANGFLTLATTLALLPGSTLSLQVQTMGVQMQMVVLSINQQPLSAGIPATATLPAQASAQPAAQFPPAPATPAPATPAPATPAVTVTAGGTLIATIVDPAPKAAPLQVSPQPGSAPVAAPPNPAPLNFAAPPLAPQEGPQLLATLFNRPAREIEPPVKGTRLPVGIVAYEPEGAVDPQALLRAAAQGREAARLLPGTVVEPDAAGQVQIRTPIGLVALSVKLPLPPQSRIVLEILGEMEPPMPLPRAGLPALGSGGGWPALEEALSVLARADPAQARHVLETAVPRPGPELARNLMAAAAAIKTGDVGVLLGERSLRALDDAGRHDLVVRLAEDFRQLAAPAPDPAGGDWRSLLVPVHDGTGHQFVRLFSRRNPKRAQNGAEGESTTRFVVEVDLTRLGAMQLDGLIKAKKFDLIVRSKAALDSGMRREIGRIFSDSIGAAGLSGNIAFQAGGRFPQMPQRATGGTALSV
jgi:hypothetical protein